MLRHEASATDKTDASYLSMTEVKKLETNSGATAPMKNCLSFSNFIKIKYNKKQF